MVDNDTIAAIATPPGMGGVGIVRISGDATEQIGNRILEGLLPPNRFAALREFKDDQEHIIDQGLALFFKGPASYTGEDLLELQGHGAPLVLDLLLAHVINLGARLARPGEFTERAFLNGKLDLAQAEAVADLIASGTEVAARAAARSLSGTFSQEIDAISKKLGEIRAYIEADIDFSDEDIDTLVPKEVARRLIFVRKTLGELLKRAKPGPLLASGAQVVIVGAPNAGKSSLMNVLCGTDRAIVSEEPGTTRDLVEATIDIDGLFVHLIDTAGLRESTEQIEGEGIRRATAAMHTADLVVVVIDDAGQLSDTVKSSIEAAEIRAPVLSVYNKCDLSKRRPGVHETPGGSAVAISAIDGSGVKELLTEIKSLLGYTIGTADPLLARRRHLIALHAADHHLLLAQSQIAEAPELLAEELRLAQSSLGEITGVVTTEDLLGEIFSSFCVGK